MYKSLQGCRAAAALLVVLHHLGSALSDPKYFGASVFALPFRSGDAGVEFFFVLSGFIIAWAHFRDLGRPSQLPRYLQKRVLRIYPVYWIIFAAVYIAAFAAPSLKPTLPHDGLTLVKALLLLPQDPLLTGGSGAPVLIVAWTLQYELCFYALFAAFILNRLLGAALCAALVGNWIACHALSRTFPGSFFANNLLLLFALGVAIALLNATGFRLRQPLWMAVMGCSAFIALGVFEAAFGEPAVIDRRLLYGACSAVVVLGLVQAEDRREIRVDNVRITRLGDASYALYLIHYPLISVLCKLAVLSGLTGLAGALVAFPLMLAVCILVAIVFHLKVEQPMLRRARRMLQNHDRRAVRATVAR